MSDLTVAVVGATGAVGRVMREILAERSFPVGQLRLMASERSAGTMLSTGSGGIEVEDLATADPSGIDVALFSAGGERSRQYAPKFAELIKAQGGRVVLYETTPTTQNAKPLSAPPDRAHASSRRRRALPEPPPRCRSDC